MQVFSKCGYHWSDPGMLLKHPLTQFGKALELLEEQRAKEYQKIAVVGVEEFVPGQERSTVQHLSTFRPSYFRSMGRD